MEFQTQAEVLEYLGKNPNDRSLIQRMIIRGDLVKKGGMYYLVDKDTIIRELKEEIERLKKGEKSEPQQSEQLNAKNFEDTAEIIKLRDKIEELKSDLEFQISENEKLQSAKERYQESIKNSYRYINETLKKKIDWYTYKAIIKLEGEIKGEENQ